MLNPTPTLRERAALALASGCHTPPGEYKAVIRGLLAELDAKPEPAIDRDKLLAAADLCARNAASCEASEYAEERQHALMWRAREAELRGML